MDSQYESSFTNLLMSEENIYDGGDHANPDIGPTMRRAQRTKKFSLAEDALLVSAWLNTSKDPITGSEQQSGSFWRRIHDYFVGNGGTEVERTQISLKNRWADINARCSKFVGYHSQIERTRQSGTNENGRLKEAREMYEKIVGKRFQYEHCWEILRSERKWTDNLPNKRQKSNSDTTAGGSSPATPESVNLGDDDEFSPNLDRPLGRKASKAEAKNKKKQNNNDNSLNYQHWQERVELEKAKAERQERMIAQQETALAQHRMQIEIEQKNWELQVMQTDTTCMDDVNATYWNGLKLEILTKRGFNL